MSRQEKFRPVGELAEICTIYQAPLDAQSILARRAGTLVGTTELPISKVEGVIQKSMADNRGVPDWSKVTDKVGSQVRDIYKRLKR